MENSGPGGDDTAQSRLRERARGGDVAAQVELAMSLGRGGQGAEAGEWLAIAAGTGNAFANALLGAWQVYGINVERDPAWGLQRLQLAAGNGDAAACTVLSDLHAEGRAAEHDWLAALDWLTAGAQLGNARALTQVALLQPGAEADPLRLMLLWAAATRAFEVAQALLGRALLTSADPQQTQAGRGWLQLARKAGSPLAGPADGKAEVAIALSGPSAIDTLPWKLIRERMAIDRFLDEPPQPGTSSTDLWLRTHPSLIPATFCDYLVALAAPHMTRASVDDNARGERRVDDVRTNSDFAFTPGSGDVLLRLVEHRLSLAAELPRAHQEPTVILRYRPGETYDDHHDYIDPAVPAFRADLETHGQRIATALVYLNEEYEGGETHFPRLQQRIRGRKGEALVWRNLRPDGSPEPLTQHAGRPPTSGEKWLLSKWIRTRPFNH